MEPNTASHLSVRPAALEDSSRIAILCGQLGCPLTDGAVAKRLKHCAHDERRQIFVVKAVDGLLIGWRSMAS